MFSTNEFCSKFFAKQQKNEIHNAVNFLKAYLFVFALATKANTKCVIFKKLWLFSL